jgi:hypothetical protein
MLRVKLGLVHGAYLLAVFFSILVNSAPVQVGLTIGGKQVMGGFGRKACNSAEQVLVVLPTEIAELNLTDFQYSFFDRSKSQEHKLQQDTGCPEKRAPDGKRVLSGNNLNIPIEEFVPPRVCSKDGEVGKKVLCIFDNTSSGTLLGFKHFDYDTSLSKITAIDGITAVNKKITFTVHYKGGSGIQFRTCYGKSAEITPDNFGKDNCKAPFQIRDSHSANIALLGLDNDKEYSFKVRLLDPRNGEGEWSEVNTITPIPVAAPLDVYNGAGGELEFGSCQQTNKPTVLVLIVSLLALFILRLRKKRFSSLFLQIGAISLTTLLVAPPKTAHAEFGTMNVGLLGAMYRPDLDSELLASGGSVFPFYKCFFRKKTTDQSGPINPLMGVEVDWHLWDGFGSLQLGFGLSYTYVPGRAVKISGGQPDCDSPVDGAKVSLHMYQLRPQLTYVFNPFAEYVPLVPYIRAGLIGHGYMFFSGGANQSGTTTGGITHKPNGFRFGYQAAVGLMLMLDFLEPSSIKTARGAGFFQHVYLKGELSYTKIDSFDRKGYQFSAKDIMGTRLPLMWTFGLVFEI